MNYQAVLFDLDGTLIDTAPGIIACAKQTMTELGIALPPEGTFHRFIGPPLPKCFEIVAGCDQDTCKKAAQHYVKIFGSQHIAQFELYDGIKPLLSRLKKDGVKLGVATYKQTAAAHASLNAFGLGEYFDVVAGSDLHSTYTKGEIITHALRDLGAARDHSIMVGDSPSDYTGAVDNGCDFIAAVYGYGFLETDQYPGVCTAQSAGDIEQFFYQS